MITDNSEKDLQKLSKSEFLKKYDYMTEQSYDAAISIFDDEMQKVLKSGIVELCTFPNTDENYCHCFSMTVENLISILEKLDDSNNRLGVNLNDFLQNYVWCETYFIHDQAEALKQIIKEYEQS